jgi:hypothetical protein
MTMLFSSIEITPLQYIVLPPYGLITEAFIPLGAFMLLVGIYTSAINLSQDGELRRDFRKSALAQLNLLRTIGIAQMEKELIKNYKLVKLAEKRYPNLETTQDYSEEDVKQIVHEVLEEIKGKDFAKRKT